MRRGMLLVTMLLGAIIAGTAAAQMSDPHPIPQVSPVVLGTVVGSNVHSVTVETPSGEQLVFETDSRTVMPDKIADGTRVRAEFHLMDSGMRRAGRITPLTTGSIDMALLEDELASTQRADYEREMEEDRALAAQQTEESEEASATYTQGENAEDRDHEHDAVAMNQEQDTYGSQSTETEANRDDQLPRTGGIQPALLAAGLFALGTGLGLRLGRRRPS